MNSYFNDQMQYIQDILNEHKEHNVSHLELNFSNMLEGFAYLTGEIRRYISSELPGVKKSLFRQLMPDLLKPIPSMTIIKFQPNAEGLYSSISIKGQTRLSPKNHASYYFTTTKTVQINPLKISNIKLDSIQSPNDLMILEMTKLNSSSLFLKDIIIYIKSNLNMSSYLYWLFLTQIRSVSVAFDDQCHHKIKIGDQAIIQSDYPLFQDEESKEAIFQKLKSLFNFFEQVFFIKIKKLDQLHIPENTRKIHFFFQFKKSISPPLNINSHMFHLNCVPVINLYQTSAEPFVLSREKFEYRLIPDATYSDQINFHDIVEVSGIKLSEDEDAQLKYTDILNKNFQVITRKDKFNREYQYLCFDTTKKLSESTISCLLTVSNGENPARYLSEKDEYEGQNISSQLNPVSISRVSTYVHEDQERIHADLIRYLTLTLSSLCQVEQIKKLLRLCHHSINNDIEKKIDSILSVDLKTTNDLHHGVFYTISEITVEIETANFFCQQESYIWGELLRAIFLRFIQINTKLKLTIILKPSLEKMIWSPIFGEKNVL